MPKFLCLQRSLPAEESSKPSPTEMQEMFTKFNEWREKYEQQLLDLGGRFGQGKLVATEESPEASFAELKSFAGGYMIVQAESLEEAAKVAEQCPGLVRPGSGCEVIEIHTP